MKNKQIAIIGSGIMGEALVRSLLRVGIPPSKITVIEKREERLKEIQSTYKISVGSITKCDVVFIAVKPQDLEETLRFIRNDLYESVLIVSFVAGQKLSFIEGFLRPLQRVVRVMSNTPMTLGKGFCAISLGRTATDEDTQWLKEVLSASGKVNIIPEHLQDTITALSGSGPAYFFTMVEVMAAAGERLGLSAVESLEIAKQVLIGAAAMVENSGIHPKTLRENVTSPNGTTFAALQVLNDEGYSELIYKAIKAAHDRAVEMGRGQ